MTKCTKCKTPIRPVVAIDIDGTLADYHRALTSFAENYFNQTMRRDYDGKEHFHKWMGVTHEEYRAMKLAFRQGGQKRSLPIHAGARLLMSTARQLGCEIWITTTRPYMRLDSIDPDTQFWLRENGIPYDYILYDEDKYKILSERVDIERVILILDDLKVQCNAALKIYPTPVVRMIRRHSNTNQYPHTPAGTQLHASIADSLFHVASDLEDRVHQWKVNNNADQ